MGDLMITEEIWNENKYNCPCLDTMNMLCSAKHGQMDKVKCDYETCPFVTWANIVK